jgi:hypothetical protein
MWTRPAPLREILARFSPTPIALVLENRQSVDEQRASAGGAAGQFNFFIPRDTTRQQYRLIELQIDVGLPLLTDLERLAK